MPSERVLARFEELCDIKRGASPRPIQDWMAPTGIPWVKIADATAAKSRFIDSTAEFIKEEAGRYSVAVHPGDFILSNSATPGLPKLMRIDACIHDGWLLLRNFRQITKEYCYYLLLNERPKLVAQGNGSVFTNLKTEILKNHVVEVPSLEEQGRVAEMLLALDDRIDLLRQTNTTLESLAQALFKSWFIDFDPVRAKAEGREPEGMDAATAALFPAEFEESALGLIPKGWRVGTVRDVCSIFDSRRVPLSGKERAERHGPYPYYGAAALMDHVNDFIFDGVYLLLGEDGSVTNPDGTPITQYVWGKFWVNNHAHVLQGANGVRTEHLMLALRGVDFTPYVTGAVQAKLNQANLFRIPFLQAGPRVSEAFGAEVAPLYEKLRANSEQAKALAELRDALLPRLISGKLRLPEAREQMEDALA